MAGPLAIHELNHVMIRVRDLEDAVRFYRDILGLRPIPRPAFDFPGAWFALGQQELHLIGDPQRPAPPGGNPHHFALRVDDPAAARRELERRGWPRLRGPAPRPDGAMQLFVTDPDGYLIELMAPPGSG